MLMSLSHPRWAISAVTPLMTIPASPPNHRVAGDWFQTRAEALHHSTRMPPTATISREMALATAARIEAVDIRGCAARSAALGEAKRRPGEDEPRRRRMKLCAASAARTSKLTRKRHTSATTKTVRYL